MRILDDVVVIAPYWFWRKIFRMPELRIPLSEVEGITKITFGIKFHVPSDPALDGARFYGYGYQPLDKPATRPLQDRGIPISAMPASGRVKGFARDLAVAGRPGWIWRDRGRLAYLETAVFGALGIGLLVVMGFFTHLPIAMKILFGFIVVLAVVQNVAGHRLRKRFQQRHTDR